MTASLTAMAFVGVAICAMSPGTVLGQKIEIVAGVECIRGDGGKVVPDSDGPDKLAGYDPDGKKLPRKQNCLWIKVPNGKTLIIRAIAEDAWYENALHVHDTYGTLQLACGNYRRDDNVVKEFSPKDGDTWYMISGWSKLHPPKASKPWRHMPKMKYERAAGGERDLLVRYEDSPSNPTDPFNDLKAVISIR